MALQCVFSKVVVFLLAAGLAVFVACGDDANSGELTMLAYNVAGLPQEVSQVNPEEHIPLISPLLNDYDIVLTQEDFDWWQPGLDGIDFANYHTRLRAQADHAYRSERHPGAEAVGIDVENDRPLLQVGDGLGLLSRFPFDRFRRLPWETCSGVAGGGSDCLAMKGFALARVELAPGIVVDVYNLHGDASGDQADRAARMVGYEQMASYILEHSAGNAVIMGGDMNLRTDAGSDDERERDDAQVWQAFLSRTGLVEVCDALSCEQPAAIDKFAYRSGGGIALEALSWRFEVEKFQDAIGEPLSDHDALAVRWRWTEE